MKTLSKRLQEVMQEGSLTKRDLQRWFDRPYPTVRFWIIGKHWPWEIWRDDVEAKLRALELLVRQRKYLPVPPSFSPRDRSDLMQALIHARDSGLSRVNPAPRR